MSTFYEMELRVDSRDVDLFNQCRPSALLGLLQEAATQAALALGVSGPELLEKYNCLWMVTRSWAELDAPLRWNDMVRVKTWHRGVSGVSSYRDFDIFREGKPVGQGVMQWVMVDADSRQLYRMKDLTEFQGTDGGGLNKSVKLRRVPLPDAFDGRARRDLRYSDTDINGTSTTSTTPISPATACTWSGWGGKNSSAPCKSGTSTSAGREKPSGWIPPSAGTIGLPGERERMGRNGLNFP